MAETADERLVVMLEARISEFEKRMAKPPRSWGPISMCSTPSGAPIM